jgi:hypothetical protein
MTSKCGDVVQLAFALSAQFAWTEMESVFVANGNGSSRYRYGIVTTA